MSFPAEAKIRAGLKKKKLKEKLEADGMTKEEIKKFFKAKAQKQEQVFDEFGSDTGPVDETETDVISSGFE